MNRVQLLLDLPELRIVLRDARTLSSGMPRIVQSANRALVGREDGSRFRHS